MVNVVFLYNDFFLSESPYEIRAHPRIRDTLSQQLPLKIGHLHKLRSRTQGQETPKLAEEGTKERKTPSNLSYMCAYHFRLSLHSALP